VNILMVAKNSPVAYSGGRYAAWLMAEALAEAGHKVVYLTNHRPVFASIDSRPGSGECSVRFVVGNPLVSRIPDCRFDSVVVVPHLRSKRMFNDDWMYYYRALSRARRDQAMVVLLSFETPNWIEAELPDGKDARDYRYWGKYAAHSHLILSISREGTRYAKGYFRSFNSGLLFAECYPPVNSRVCDAVPDQAKENLVVLITRFTDAHKNAESILGLVDARLGGYTLEIINGVGGIPPNTRVALQDRCEAHQVRLEIRERITDREKFVDLKRAKLLVYPSLFEGFGMPPVEAQYCGTRVVAFDLPVLREVNRWPENIQFVPRGDYEALRQRSFDMLAEPYDAEKVRMNISSIAKFDAYVKQVHRKITDAHRQTMERQ